MNERILQLIDSTGLSAIQFADKVGLNRSIIYHIKNGRSAPSLDVVLKILNVFPQINTDWLLYGKGEMLHQDISSYPESDLFSVEHTHIPESLPIVSNPNEESVSENLQSDEEPTSSVSSVKENPILEPSGRTPIKMMIFYSDNSFEVFSLEKGSLM